MYFRPVCSLISLSLVGVVQIHAGGHGREAVLALLHGQRDVTPVAGRVGKHGDGVDLVVQHEFLQRLVGLLAGEDLHEEVAAVGLQIADRLDDAVGMLMPGEAAAESAAHHADADLAVRDGFPRRGRRGGIGTAGCRRHRAHRRAEGAGDGAAEEGATGEGVLGAGHGCLLFEIRWERHARKCDPPRDPNAGTSILTERSFVVKHLLFPPVRRTRPCALRSAYGVCRPRPAWAAYLFAGALLRAQSA